jgi:glycine/D-amino acid oxidase-like deaminating enzyme
MIPFSKLSFWERSVYLDGIDFAIIGAGIVGMSTALHLRKRFPSSKIVVLERGYLPTGASTKNAGFTCFGSPTELRDDLKIMSEQVVWDTVAMRMEGLQELMALIDPVDMSHQPCGSWDLISSEEELLPDAFIAYLNEKVKEISGKENTYAIDHLKLEQSKMEGFQAAYHNRLEGAIHIGKLIQALHRSCLNEGIHILFDMEVLSFEATENGVLLQTKMGELTTAKLLVCTNAFAHSYMADVRPARAQVLITKPISNLSIHGTFHMEGGYYYFRNIDNRILFGGGRNLDFDGETTTEFGTSKLIQEKLLHYLRVNILPSTSFEVDYSWSGIMAVGSEKKPIIHKTNKNIAFGVRMGGMGLAIGASVGKELSKIIS